METESTLPQKVLTAIIAFGLIAAVLSAFALHGQGTPTASKLPDGVALRVGDTDISDRTLEREVSIALQQMEAQGQGTPGDDDTQFAAIRQGVAAELVRAEIHRAEVKDCGAPCAVSPAAAQRRLDAIVKDQFDDDRGKMLSYIAQLGISEDDVLRDMRDAIGIEKLYAQIDGDLTVNGRQMRDFYRQNRERYRTPAGRNVWHILTETRPEALELRRRIAGGEPFEEVAREHSTDTGSALHGGALGMFQDGQFVPEFDSATKALADGEVSEPVKTTFGWHLIRVEDTPAKLPRLGDVSTQVRNDLTDQLRQERRAAFASDVEARWGPRIVYADEALDPRLNAPAMPNASPQP